MSPQDGLQKAATQPSPPVDAHQEAEAESKQQQTQPQEQKQPDQPEPMLDDTDDLLPSAEVLRNAVTAQQQLLAAFDAPEASVDAPAGASDNKGEPNAFDKNNGSSSPGSSSRSDTNTSSLQQQQQSPVQIGGLFRIGSTGPKPSVVVRISSDVLSCHMENYFGKWPPLLPLLLLLPPLTIAATATLLCASATVDSSSSSHVLIFFVLLVWVLLCPNDFAGSAASGISVQSASVSEEQL